MSSFPHPHRARQSNTWGSGIGRWLLWSSLGFMAVVAGATGALVGFVLPQMILPGEMTTEELRVFRTNEVRNAALDRSLHILVMGSDLGQIQPGRGSAAGLDGRSDTLLLAKVNPQDGKITILSIPRDTQVPIPGHSVQKINAANVFGGPALTAQVVSNLVGDVPIDRYVRLNTKGIVALVDAIGGVDVYVPEPMRYVDRTQKLNIDLQPGQQRLNGEQAHGFLRFRHDLLGDVGRVQRQQTLIRALSRELLQPSTWARVPQILDAIRDNVETNLTWEELLALFRILLSKDNLDLVLLPGRFSRPGEFHASYWIPDARGIARLAASRFGADLPVSPSRRRPLSDLRIAVQNASGRPRVARAFAQELQRKGFDYIITIADDPQILSTTAIIAQRGDGQAAQEMRVLLGIGQVRVESTGVLDSDITIRVGQDWQLPAR